MNISVHPIKPITKESVIEELSNFDGKIDNKFNRDKIKSLQEELRRLENTSITEQHPKPIEGLMVYFTVTN